MHQLSTFLLLFGSFLLIFLIWSAILIIKGRNLQKKLLSQADVTFYGKVEFLVFSKSKINATSSLMTKLDLAVDQRNVYFYPTKFHMGLLSSMSPLSFPYKHRGFTASSVFQKSLSLKVNADLATYYFLHPLFVKPSLEISLTFPSVELRDEFYSAIMPDKSL